MYNLRKAGLSSVVAGALIFSSATTVAAGPQTYALGNAGSIVANADSDVQFSEANGQYTVDLAKGGLCLTADKSTPLTITAGSESIDLNSFAANDQGIVNGAVVSDDTGVYFGSVGTCSGATSVTTAGGTNLTPVIVFGAAVIIAASSSGSSNDPAPADPAPAPAAPAPAAPPPVATGGGGGGGGGGTPPTPVMSPS